MSDSSQIVVASSLLDQIRFPELPQPPVGPEETPTLELVTWASQLYCFSLLAHFREMLRSFIFLAQNSFVPTSFVTARCLFEMAAHAHYTHKHVVQYLDARDLKRVWEFLLEINMGSRYKCEEYGDRSEDLPPPPAPREIAKIIRSFDEWMSKADGKATTEYSFLSEFAHPNMAAFSHYYTVESKEGGLSAVRFVDPPRGLSAAPWQHVLISLLACLHFASQLLKHVGEREIASQIAAILESSPRTEPGTD